MSNLMPQMFYHSFQSYEINLGWKVWVRGYVQLALLPKSIR